jgi:hypothetical protein
MNVRLGRFLFSERTHESRISLEIAVDYVIFRVQTSMSLAELVAKDAAQMLGSAWKTLDFWWFRGAGWRNVNRIG